MKASASLPLLRFYEDRSREIQGDRSQGSRCTERTRDDDEFDDIEENVKCMNLERRQKSARGDELSVGRYGLWRQKHKYKAARLGKQLKAKWEFEELLEEQLYKFHAHYNGAVVPTSLDDVCQLLMPKWALPQELASLFWLGDWRPSVILELLCALVRCSSWSMSSSLYNLNNPKTLLSQLVKEIRIEEAVIDAEMTEIQATCVLHLPFSPVNNCRSETAALSCIQAEFRKIGRVINKAQQLRFKALELVVKKVLNPTDAAEFLVAFAGIQDVIHQYAQRLPKDHVNVPVKALMLS